MRVLDRLRDPVAIVEASLLGAAGVIVALLGPWYRWLPVVSGLLIIVVVLAIATRPQPVPVPRQAVERPRSDPPPADPQRLEDVARSVREAAAVVRRWKNEADSHYDGVARDADRLAGDIVRLVLDCELEIERIGDQSAVQQTEDDLRRLANHFTVYVNAGDAPRDSDNWNDLEGRFEWIILQLRGLLKRLRESEAHQG